jgi:hypothetical protein
MNRCRHGDCIHKTAYVPIPDPNVTYDKEYTGLNVHVAMTLTVTKAYQNITVLQFTAFKNIFKSSYPRTGDEVPEGEYRYSTTLSLTSPLYGVGGQRSAPAALPPGKTR